MLYRLQSTGALIAQLRIKIIAYYNSPNNFPHRSILNTISTIIIMACIYISTISIMISILSMIIIISHKYKHIISIISIALSILNIIISLLSKHQLVAESDNLPAS